MTSISNICKQLTSNLSNLNNFHSLEVVDRVSETQLQVGENSNWIIWRLFKCKWENIKTIPIIWHLEDGPRTFYFRSKISECSWLMWNLCYTFTDIVIIQEMRVIQEPIMVTVQSIVLNLSSVFIYCLNTNYSECFPFIPDHYFLLYFRTNLLMFIYLYFHFA